MNVAFGTIAAGNFRAHALVLAASCRCLYPEFPFYFLLLDTPGSREQEDKLGVRLVSLQDVVTAGSSKMRRRYDSKQLSSALKPALLKWILQQQDCQAAVYLDADMLLLDRIDDVLETVSRHAVTLSPHVLAGSDEAGGSALERELLMVGMYNAGFLGITASQDALAFLDWWEQRLKSHCVESVRDGLHYDQRWLDMAPAYVADLLVLRGPGLNVAYWNASHLAPDTPVRLMHFSGFEPESPQYVTKYRPGLPLEAMGRLQPLFAGYRQRLMDAGYLEASGRRLPWGEKRNPFARSWRRLRRVGSTFWRTLSRAATPGS